MDACGSPAHILAKFGAPPNPTKPREVFRTEFNRKASLWEAKQVKLATECALAVESLPFGPVKGVRGNLPPPRHARTLFLPMLTALGARVCRVEAPPAKEPEAGAGRGGAASWVQHEQCACPGVPFTLWAVCGFCRLEQ